MVDKNWVSIGYFVGAFVVFYLIYGNALVAIPGAFIVDYFGTRKWVKQQQANQTTDAK